MDPNQDPAQSPEERLQLLGFTPAALRAWFRAAPGWRSFDAAYLVAWGARYLPDVSLTHWWLWVTSGEHACIHPSALQAAYEQGYPMTSLWVLIL